MEKDSNVRDAGFEDDVKVSKKLARSMTSTSIPDSSIPVKKLIYALLAISLGTVIECEFTARRSAVLKRVSQLYVVDDIPTVLDWIAYSSSNAIQPLIPAVFVFMHAGFDFTVSMSSTGRRQQQ